MELLYWVRYMAQIVLDGDYTNKWLQEMPPEIVECVYEVGKYISGLMGYT